MLLWSHCFDKIVCMCGCICEYEQDKQKMERGTHTHTHFKEVNAINKGQYI